MAGALSTTVLMTYLGVVTVNQLTNLQYLFCMKVSFLYVLHSLKHRPGGWGLIPEMIQVCDLYILKVLDEQNTPIYVRPLNEWQIPKLRHFEVGNFGPKMTFFRL